MHKQATAPLSPDRFDAAIDSTISRDPEMRFEYEKTALAFTIARLVRDMREHHNLTQSALAEKVEVPQSFISRLENPNSKKEPSIATLAKVMHAFGYKVVIDFELERKPPRVVLQKESRRSAEDA